MNCTIKRLGPGDEAILELLAREDADFDLNERASTRQPLDAHTARRYLENPTVLHWVAVEQATIVGFLSCSLIPLRSGSGRELLLYEIGVRNAYRRLGVGRALLAHLETWMRAENIEEVWVLADNPAAVKFYCACGFSTSGTQPVYMTRKLR